LLKTIEADLMVKKVSLSGQEVEARIWDTAGQERFAAVGSSLYRFIQPIKLHWAPHLFIYLFAHQPSPARGRHNKLNNKLNNKYV
jgi:hypothetical protein